MIRTAYHAIDNSYFASLSHLHVGPPPLPHPSDDDTAQTACALTEQQKTPIDLKSAVLCSRMINFGLCFPVEQVDQMATLAEDAEDPVQEITEGPVSLVPDGVQPKGAMGTIVPTPEQSVVAKIVAVMFSALHPYTRPFKPGGGASQTPIGRDNASRISPVAGQPSGAS